MKKFLLFLCFIPSMVFAEISLPSVFSDGMVLQQNAEVSIWGKADAGSAVTVEPSWLDNKIGAVADGEGNWKVKVKTGTADFKPYSLTISQKGSKVEISDIVFGEVWFCSGQSNMVMKMKGWYHAPVYGSREAIANSTNNYIRIFDVPLGGAAEEKFTVKSKWQKAAPGSVYMASATAYFFGKQLFSTLNVPVALITAAYPGASIIAFMSKESMKAYPQYKLPLPGDRRFGYRKPTGYYNAMVSPVVGYGIKGTIWYQGESDRNTPDLYRQLFTSMLADWRAKWGMGDFPFIYAQIAPYNYGKETENSAYFREAQAKGAKENKNAYMVSMTDIGEEHNIHPSEKKTAGFRLAAMALNKVYGIEGIYCDEPEYKSMTVENGKAVLSFENASGGLTSYGQTMTNFVIAGSDKVFYPATAVFRGNSIIVSSDKVPEPVAVRYAFTDFAKGCLYNIEGCCASSFRTDNWKESECKFVR